MNEPSVPVSTSPALSFEPELLLRAQGRGLGMRAAIVDVDGVMTDGRLYIDGHGEQVKAFNVLDGHGLKLLMRGGIVPLVVSGRESEALRRRVADLGLPHAAFASSDKVQSAQALLDLIEVGWDEVAVIGDDWPDLPLMARAAFAVAPPGAHAEVLAVAHHVTRARAGEGAVREFCDLLLVAAGRYASLLQATTATLDAR